MRSCSAASSSSGPMVASARCHSRRSNRSFDRRECSVDPLARRKVLLDVWRTNEWMPKSYFRSVNLDQLCQIAGCQPINVTCLPRPLRQREGFHGEKAHRFRCNKQQVWVEFVSSTIGWKRHAPAARLTEATEHRESATRSPRGSSTRANGLPQASLRAVTHIGRKGWGVMVQQSLSIGVV
jgi:hypothetical protein